MNLKIGKKVRQKDGFSAFVLNPFPQKSLFKVPADILLKAAQAEREVGKLDGMTYILPDRDFFLYMFMAKDAEASSQIEGTKATLIDVFKQQARTASRKTDADDIIHYLKALNYGMRRLKNFPLSLRFIREIHQQLMTGTRATQFSDPGHFRKSQNYIGGTRPGNAHFVPPPVPDMHRALSDFEKFLHQEGPLLSCIYIGLIHAQFETIHPFLDGNGRVGRLLMTFLFCEKKLLSSPVLFLSAWFKKHQKTYYQKLDDYHNGRIQSWIHFFLDAVIETSQNAIEISKKITKLRDRDIKKITSLAKRESESGTRVLTRLFKEPVVTTTVIMKWTGFTRAGAAKLIDRFVSLQILKPFSKNDKHNKTYIYSAYVALFKDK